MLSFSPYARISQVPIQLIFDVVRYLMFRWGFIPVLRVDNGSPFGDPSRQAWSGLNMHLLALGIRLKLNPPRSPTKNAKVERNQGTTSRWADPSVCANFIELQHHLNMAVIDQRENYRTRTCNGETRAEKYPGLFTNPKRFHPDDFNAQRVYDKLEKGAWQRKVSAQGATTLFTQTYQVGAKHKNTIVTATFCAKSLKWIFRNKRGEFLRSCDALKLDHNSIFTFSTGQ